MKQGLVVFGFVLGGLVFFITSNTLALQSTHYQFTETSLGGSGSYGSHSANYQSQQAVGILGVGSLASPNFQTKAGNITTNDPALAFAVNSTTVALGDFSAAATATATATFQVLNYTSFGYVVQIVGTAPTMTSPSHTITAMATTGPSQAGTDQFGINLVANTSPISFGANPDHGQFGFGSAETGYDTANNYRFVSGETIASAPKSSGLTTYTISYIVNVSSLDPGGQYVGSETLVCTGTY